MRNLMAEELECVAGGTETVPVKGNNGWGNGPDSTNAGSFSGGVEETKNNNQRDGGEVTPGPDKFDQR